MRDPRKAALARAAMAAFAPLGALFVELGISSPEAESLLRSVLVHGAFERTPKVDGKPVNLSRIALLTGVHRNEVKRILSSPPGIDPGREVRRHRANRVLAAWYSDPDYTNPDGEPKELELRTRRRHGVSFWSLVSQCAPGVWPTMILDELVRVGAVEQTEDSRLRVRMRSYAVAGLDIEAIEELGRRARDLLQTLVHNLQHPELARVCETVLTVDADARWLPVLRNTLQRRSRTFTAALSEELNSQRTSRASQKDPGARIGLTVYSFEDAAPAPAEARKPRRRAS
jgi:uncharacterized protein DUF6502